MVIENITTAYQAAPTCANRISALALSSLSNAREKPNILTNSKAHRAFSEHALTATVDPK